MLGMLVTPSVDLKTVLALAYDRWRLSEAPLEVCGVVLIELLDALTELPPVHTCDRGAMSSKVTNATLAIASGSVA
jgi:hypothetical protein